MLTLYYDGLCPLCSREIEHYRRHLPPETRFLDITSPGFDASAHGLNSQAVQRELHVQVGDEIRTGVDAFLAIFDAIPRYRWFARLGRLGLVHFGLTIGYAAFVCVRPWLPRRTPDCASGTCSTQPTE